MAGRGKAPKADRKNPRDVPIRGEVRATELEGWQHGVTPDPPEGLMAASVEAWETWMGSWFAAFWGPSDLPGLRQLVRLYDQVERNEFQRAAELRLQMDTYGITPKGQQDRRWARVKVDPVKAPSGGGGGGKSYGHLKTVS